MAGRAIAQFKKKKDAETSNKPEETMGTANSTPETSSSDVSMSQEERIRIRAYELYMLRNGRNGSEVDDWLRAETEILGA